MEKGRILVAEQHGAYCMKFVGDVRLTLCTTIDMYVEAMLADRSFASVLIDLRDAECLDSTTLGLLAKVAIGCRARCGVDPTAVSGNANIDRILESVGFDRVFDMRDTMPEAVAELAELPMVRASEESVRAKVIEAHRTLMGLNEANRVAFEDLVLALEND